MDETEDSSRLQAICASYHHTRQAGSLPDDQIHSFALTVAYTYAGALSDMQLAPRTSATEEVRLALTGTLYT